MAHARDTIVTTLLAFAGGFVAGILLAPESGQKTRERIATEARSRLRRLEAKLDDLQAQMSGLQDSIRGATGEVGRKVRAAGAEAGEKVREAAQRAVEQVLPDVSDNPIRIDSGDVAHDLPRMPRR